MREQAREVDHPTCSGGQLADELGAVRAQTQEVDELDDPRVDLAFGVIRVG